MVKKSIYDFSKDISAKGTYRNRAELEHISQISVSPHPGSFYSTHKYLFHRIFLTFCTNSIQSCFSLMSMQGYWSQYPILFKPEQTLRKK